MKRTNLVLKNTVFLTIAGILCLLLFNSIENNNLKNTIGEVYYQSIQDTLLSVQRSVVQDDHFQKKFSEVEKEIPDDMVALFLQDDEVKDLNQGSSPKKLFNLVHYHFITSQKGRDLLQQNSNSLKRFLYWDGRNHQRSFYLALQNVSEGDQQGILLLAKDSSIWDAYLLHSKTLFFFLIVIYLGLIFYYHRQQQTTVYEPIREMTEVAFNYSENNFDENMPIKANDEVGNLAVALNKLGKTIEASHLMNTKERNLLSLVFDSLSVGVIYLDEDLTVTVLNSVGNQYYAAYTKTVEQAHNEDFKQKYVEVVEEVFQTGIGKKMEIQQTQTIFEVRFSPLWNEEEEAVKGVLMMIEDVTNAKRLASIREDLITNVSHDFRTPLATIKGYSEAIIDDVAGTPEEKNEMAKIIFDEANELSRTINSLLDLSRINAGYEHLNLQIVHLPTFFKHILSRFTEKLRSEKIQYSLSVLNDLEYYQMDEEKMNHVIYNLIDNAIRYSADPTDRESRYLKLEVRLDEWLDEILFIVSDNGIGISQESIPYIFERFYKDDKARTREKQKGTGIGLSLVASIVKEHAGKVEVESQEGKGTVFTIRLPYKETSYENIEDISKTFGSFQP